MRVYADGGECARVNGEVSVPGCLGARRLVRRPVSMFQPTAFVLIVDGGFS